MKDGEKTEKTKKRANEGATPSPRKTLFICALLLLFSLGLYLFKPTEIQEIFIAEASVFIKIAVITFFAVLISAVIHFLVPDTYVKDRLGLGKNMRGRLPLIAIVGIITPGPIYAIYPLVFVLKEKGMSEENIVTFMTAQMMTGPARAPLEIGFFGLGFYLLRVILAFFLSILAGFMYRLLLWRAPRKGRL